MDMPLAVWRDVPNHLLIVGVAYVLAMPVGWDREKEDRSAGIRTFPIIAMASCGFVLVAREVLGTSPGHDRILQGLITGIGFLAGGAILKGPGGVQGMATAASAWNTAVVGAAVGYGYWDIGVVLSVVNFITLRWLWPLKRQANQDAPPSG